MGGVASLDARWAMILSERLGGGTGAWRGLLPPFVLVAAGFGVLEHVLESVPGYLFLTFNLDASGPAVREAYDALDAALRVALVPFVLFLAFYLLASRRGVDLRGSGSGILVSVFVGTLAVFLPLDVGQAALGQVMPGFTRAESAVEYAGAAVGASLTHAFVGFSGVFLWKLSKAEAPGEASGYRAAGPSRGTEDLSLVGVLMVVVFAWEYMAEAYQATFPGGAGNSVAAGLAGVLGGGSPLFYPLAIWQQSVLIMIVPFALFFLVARRERLNPFLQARKISAVLLLWGLFLRGFTSYFYVYFARLFDPAAFPSATLASTISAELAPVDALLGVVASTFGFCFLGLAGVVLGFLSKVPPPSVPASAHERAPPPDARDEAISLITVREVKRLISGAGPRRPNGSDSRHLPRPKEGDVQGKIHQANPVDLP